MKPLWILLLLTFLPGCAGFEDSYFEPADAVDFAPPSSSCPCQNASYRTSPAASAITPSTSQLPTIQTREPEAGNR
jgi:hypothetical protein